MKKYIYIVFLLFFFSCNDFLELTPPSGLEQEEYWQTKEQLEDVMMSAYVALSDLDSEFFIYGELRADMVEMNNVEINAYKIIQGNIEPDNNYAKWNKFYQVIKYANYVLDFADLVAERDPTFSEYGLQTSKSEALFLRSLAYFYIVRIWKDAPLVLTSPKNDSQDFFLPKSNSEEILDRIEQDMLLAIKTPPAFDNIAENKIRCNKAAMNALIAEIALWRFEYSDCIGYCDAILADENYLLLPSSLWFNLFYPGSSLESIFEIYYDESKNQPNDLGQILNSTGGTYVASEKSIELLDKNLELWRTFSFHPDNYSISKYISTNGLNKRSFIRSANFIIYRLADVMLMKAEALAQSGRITEAMVLVNAIRERAAVTQLATPDSPQDAEDIVLAERARELAFEGKRWFDLMRMARRNNYERKDELIFILTERIPSSQKKILAGKLENPYGWYYPIHVDEYENNINLVQNPYYASFSNRQ